MKRIPLMYQSEEQTKDLVLSTRSNKLGEVFHVVEYLNNDGSKDYAFFSHLSSALDFIHSNFK
jgi:hypothetical protein